jgi:hypothetical protein
VAMPTFTLHVLISFPLFFNDQAFIDWFAKYFGIMAAKSTKGPGFVGIKFCPEWFVYFII